MTSSKELQETVTKEYLGEYTEKVILPGVEAILKKSMQEFEATLTDQLDVREEKMRDKLSGMKNEILTSNDALAKKLDKIDQEVTFSLANYDRLSKKIEWLEKTVAMLANKAGVKLPA